MGNKHAYELRDLVSVRLLTDSMHILAVGGHFVLRHTISFDSVDKRARHLEELNRRCSYLHDQTAQVYGFQIKQSHGQPILQSYSEWDSSNLLQEIEKRAFKQEFFPEDYIWKLARMLTQLVLKPFKLEPLPSISPQTILTYKFKLVDAFMFGNNPYFHTNIIPNNQILKTLIQVMRLKLLPSLNRSVFQSQVKFIANYYSQELVDLLRQLSQGKVRTVSMLNELEDQMRKRKCQNSQIIVLKISQSQFDKSTQAQQHKRNRRESSQDFKENFQQFQRKSIPKVGQVHISRFDQPSLIRKNKPALIENCQTRRRISPKPFLERKQSKQIKIERQEKQVKCKAQANKICNLMYLNQQGGKASSIPKRPEIKSYISRKPEQKVQVRQLQESFLQKTWENREEEDISRLVNNIQRQSYLINNNNCRKYQQRPNLRKQLYFQKEKKISEEKGGLKRCMHKNAKAYLNFQAQNDMGYFNRRASTFLSQEKTFQKNFLKQQSQKPVNPVPAQNNNRLRLVAREQDPYFQVKKSMGNLLQSRQIRQNSKGFKQKQLKLGRDSELPDGLRLYGKPRREE